MFSDGQIFIRFVAAAFTAGVVAVEERVCFMTARDIFSRNSRAGRGMSFRVSRFLLVTDDETIGEALVDTMRRGGYAIDWVRDGCNAELTLAHNTYDLVLLDLGIPRTQGIDLLQRYRCRGGNAEVMILSAETRVDTCIEALDAGADDYLAKPFDMREAAARVRALLRSRKGQSNRICTNGKLILDADKHEVTSGGMPLILPRKEFTLLRIFMEEPRRVFTRCELESRLYNGDTVGSNTIEVHVCSLRRKVGTDQVVTVRGVGYRLGNTADVAAA